MTPCLYTTCCCWGDRLCLEGSSEFWKGREALESIKAARIPYTIHNLQSITEVKMTRALLVHALYGAEWQPRKMRVRKAVETEVDKVGCFKEREFKEIRYSTVQYYALVLRYDRFYLQSISNAYRQLHFDRIVNATLCCFSRSSFNALAFLS